MAINIENKTVGRVIMFLLVFVVAIWGIFQLYSKIKELNVKKADVETQIQKETAILEELKVLENADAEIEKVMSAIPDGDKMPDVISQLSDLARKSALNLISINSSNEIEVNKNMKKKDVIVVLAGNQENFKSFMKSLEGLARFANVSSIKTESNKNNFSSFTVNVSIYYF